MSSAIFLASKAAPKIPFLPRPAMYSPVSPFHAFGDGFLGNPSSEKKLQLSCPVATTRMEQLQLSVAGFVFNPSIVSAK